MTKRLLHYCIYSVFGLLVALLVLTAWLAARLAEGPLPLTFIVPVIERALNHLSAPYTFTADQLVVTWRGWHDGLDLGLVGIEVRARKPAAVLGVPQLVLKLSAPAMRQWVIALEEVDAHGVKLRLERDADGHFGLGVPATDAKSEDGEFVPAPAAGRNPGAAEPRRSGQLSGTGGADRCRPRLWSIRRRD